MLKLIASALLVLGTAGAASADASPRSSTLLSDSTAAQRAAAARVQRASNDLRQSEQELRTLQRQLDHSTDAYNAAVRAHQARRATLLDGRIAKLHDRAESAEVRRDLQRAHLQILRVDYQRAKQNVYTAAGGREAIRNGDRG